METIQGSRCPQCGWVVAPAARICPRHPVEMIPVAFPGYGSVLSYTTLTSPPEGFKAPLHIAMVELPGGARIFCHGRQSRDLKIGRRVAIEQVDGIFYFAHLKITERVELFWKRRGAAPERTTGALKSAVKRFFKFQFQPSATSEPEEDQDKPEDANPPLEKK